MTDRAYLTVENVLRIHERELARYGGLQGIRDRGSLESAMARPQSGYYANLLEEAAALMESLALNHPFLDGNKRVAFFATDVFLKLNGYKITCDDQQAYEHFMQLFDRGEFRFKALLAWLENHAKPCCN